MENQVNQTNVIDIPNRRLIRRYENNRKLYDTKKKGYIQLKNVLEYLNNGENVIIINNKTNQDVTKEILINAYAKKLKSQQNLTVSEVVNLIKSL